MQKPRIGSHTVTFTNGTKMEIFVLVHIEGATSAVLFQDKAHPRSAFQILEYHEDAKTWGVMNMKNPITYWPVKASWQKE